MLLSSRDYNRGGLMKKVLIIILCLVMFGCSNVQKAWDGTTQFFKSGYDKMMGNNNEETEDVKKINQEADKETIKVDEVKKEVKIEKVEVKKDTTDLKKEEKLTNIEKNKKIEDSQNETVNHNLDKERYKKDYLKIKKNYEKNSNIKVRLTYLDDDGFKIEIIDKEYGDKTVEYFRKNISSYDVYEKTVYSGITEVKVKRLAVLLDDYVKGKNYFKQLTKRKGYNYLSKNNFILIINKGRTMIVNLMYGSYYNVYKLNKEVKRIDNFNFAQKGIITVKTKIYDINNLDQIVYDYKE